MDAVTDAAAASVLLETENRTESVDIGWPLLISCDHDTAALMSDVDYLDVSEEDGEAPTFQVII